VGIGIRKTWTTATTQYANYCGCMTHSLSNLGSRLNDVSGGPLVFEIWRLPGGPLVTSQPYTMKLQNISKMFENACEKNCEIKISHLHATSCQRPLDMSQGVVHHRLSDRLLHLRCCKLQSPYHWMQCQSPSPTSSVIQPNISTSKTNLQYISNQLGPYW